MATSNHEHVGRAMDLLKKGLLPFVEREMKAVYKNDWVDRARYSIPERQRNSIPDNWDIQGLVQIIRDQWKDVFGKTLGHSERTLVNEVGETRNKWAHQNRFTADDAERAYDSVERLLQSMSSPEADIARAEKLALKRLNFEEEQRKQTRKSAEVAVEGRPEAGLKPWREVIAPHPNVQNGKYVTAEFALDLWQVFNEGKKAGDDGDPTEFFKRTYLTAGLKDLLMNALRRLNNHGADPVIELETNFGGGKTHSMVALFHFFGAKDRGALPGTEDLIKEAGISQPPKVSRAVIVGNKITPGKIYVKPDGTRVRTLWGEMAWQIGGKEGYAMVKEADERAVNPGDSLRALFTKFAPCLILIDEWIAYARQLYEKSDLGCGDFDTHFTFAQTLTEAARDAGKTLLVLSIPASDNEIGGQGGQEALNRLKNVVARVQTSWHPATTEESFEIVRRRLFQTVGDLAARDQVVKAFADMYRKKQSEFPGDASKGEYEKRLRAAYPIHPELFDRLYNDWGSLDRFQRTRGVLRFMSAVIHNLWVRGDSSLMILPGLVPIDAAAVKSELHKVLGPTWSPVIERDVDGAASLPLQIDGENDAFGRYSAARRVARTVYLGSAPMLGAAHRGIEDRQIKLGCVQPGETPGTFGDALRRLSGQATFLYTEGNRYWFSTQPNLNREAEERAEKVEIELVHDEIKRRLQKVKKGETFARVYACPVKSDVGDEMDARLVILESRVAHSAKQQNTDACRLALEILNDRGTGNREYRNALVFLAADKTRLDDLIKGVRQYLAWDAIVKDAASGRLNLDSYNEKTAEERVVQEDGTAGRRITETYCWLLVPDEQKDAEGRPTTMLQEFRLQGDEDLPERAAKKLRSTALLVVEMGGVVLRGEMDKVPLWRGDHVGVKQLADDFARYLYLPRLKNTRVLLDAIAKGVNDTNWRQETFGYADDFDAATGRYRGLRGGSLPDVLLNAQSLVVKPGIAVRQFDAETPPLAPTGSVTAAPGTAPITTTRGAATPPQRSLPKRFHATVELAADRLSRDADQVAREVVTHLTGLLDSKVRVTLEIEADIPSGAPDHVVRTVTENCRTLKIPNAGFEVE